jgi:CRISPR-associated protein Cmr3
MRYLVTLKPLKPFFFGGDITFGELGKEGSSYLVHSRKFPQQTALLGMIRKEILVQSGLLTTKRKGEWVDYKSEATKMVGDTKFLFNQNQAFGVLKSLSPLFLTNGKKSFIKKVAIDDYGYDAGLIKEYDPKKDIYDNYISLDNTESKQSSDIFKPVEQIGIKKGGGDDAFYKKTSFVLKDHFKFAFYVELDFDLKSSYITLGGEKSVFKMDVTPSNERLAYQDKNGYLTLLSDAYISLAIKEHCDFAITSEISFRYLENEFNGKKRKFKKSKNIFLYEKGSVFINPSSELIKNLDNKALQKVGYNTF